VACSFGYSETPVSELAPDAVIDHFRELQSAVASLIAKRAPITGS
jgi:hypothetical protein